MALKIKWNDDRVRGAATAILLLSRDRLSRGESHELIESSLAEYRADPDAYKKNKADWPDARELDRLKKPSHIAYHQNLISHLDALQEKLTRAKRQFNSLRELDNFFIANLPGEPE